VAINIKTNTAVKVNVKEHILDIVPLRSESQPQKRSGMQGSYQTSQVVFHDFPAPFVVFSTTFQDPVVRRVDVLVFFFNMVNATFAAHSYGMLYKLLCHFTSNVPVVTNANVKILHCLEIIQRHHQKICHTRYSHFHDFPGPRPDSRTFQAWKM